RPALVEPPAPTLSPYTTLFRSDAVAVVVAPVADLDPRSGRALADEHAASAYLGADRAFAGVGPAGRAALRVTVVDDAVAVVVLADRKSTRLNSSHVKISYAVFC